MNRGINRLTTKQRRQKAKSMLTTAHILIAVVALIECFLLITFTTYSWIESASSLVIENGTSSGTATHTTDSGVTYFDISTALKYGVDMESIAHDETPTYADLKEYYSVVSQYHLSKATSPDGIDFYFPLRNNTYSGASTYRRGDTTDYNTSYNYFDFVIFNTYGGRDFFFDDSAPDGFDEVFTVTLPQENPSVTYNNETYTLDSAFEYDPDGTPNNGDEVQMKFSDAIKSAMRLSITTVTDDGNTDSHIYSVYGDAYNSMNIAGAANGPYNDSMIFDNGKSVDQGVGGNGLLRRIEDYQGVQKNPVFKAPKGSSVQSGTSKTYVSVRVWFEIMDPRFQKAFGFERDASAQTPLQRELFGLVPCADIGINFRFVNNSNDYNRIIFNDYTISEVENASHVTEERAENYRVYIKAVNPEYNENNIADEQAPYLYIPLAKQVSSPEGSIEWFSGSLTQNVVTYLKEEDSSAITFIYGRWDSETNAPADTDNVIYQWNITEAPTTSGNHVYNAYTVNASGATTNVCLGQWDDNNDQTPPNVTLVRFEDRSTAVTAAAYNSGEGNYAFMHDVSGSRVYIGSAMDPYTGISSTVTMYYNSTSGCYESYVPTSWMENGDTVYFNFAVDGSYLTANSSCIRWTSAIDSTTAALIGTTVPIYKAVGYGGNVLYNYYHESTDTLTGVGTWGNTFHRISFSTELIDAESALSSASIYFAGISGVNGAVNNAVTYCAMLPGEDYQSFYIDLPVELTGSPIVFASYTQAFSSGTVNGKWYAPTPPDLEAATYYAVTIDTADDAASNYVDLDAGDARGAWNVAVLVDATYENLIYDTVLGQYKTGGAKLQYAVSSDGASYGTPVTIASYNGTAIDNYINSIDQYRWYALLNESITHVKWIWTPYDGTGGTIATNFEYIQDLSSGKYCFVTEAVDHSPQSSQSSGE